MRKYDPRTRYKVSKSQELMLLYVQKYRFVSSDILAELLERDRSTIYERLNVLVEQGYVAKQYDKTFRIRQRPATYCLAPAGIRYLKHAGYDRTQLHYKNKNFTEEQIDEQLLLAKLARTVWRPYHNTFNGYTKYQLGKDDSLPQPAPFFKLAGKTDTTPDYFIEYFPAFTASWKLRRRINQHTNAADESDDTYPYLLLVAGNRSTERRLVNMTADLYADFEVLVTTEERLLSGKKKIWLRPYEVDWDDDPPAEFVELLVEYDD